MKLSRREIIMAIVMAWTLIGSVYYYFFYVPEREKLEQLQQTNYQLEQHKKSGPKVVTANTDDTVLLEYQQLLEKMPEQPFLPEILALVNDVAAQSDTELSGINYGQKGSQTAENLLSGSETAKNEVSKSVPYQSIPIEFEVRGNYYQIKSFIQTIELSSRLITVNKLELLATAVKQEQPERQIPEDQIIPATEAEPAPKQVGSDLYDADNLIMTIKLTAFYDLKSIKGQSGVTSSVAPPLEPKEDPYRK